MHHFACHPVIVRVCVWCQRVRADEGFQSLFYSCLPCWRRMLRAVTMNQNNKWVHKTKPTLESFKAPLKKKNEKRNRKFKQLRSFDKLWLKMLWTYDLDAVLCVEMNKPAPLCILCRLTMGIFNRLYANGYLLHGQEQPQWSAAEFPISTEQTFQIWPPSVSQTLVPWP